MLLNWTESGHHTICNATVVVLMLLRVFVVVVCRNLVVGTIQLFVRFIVIVIIFVADSKISAYI
ncbi:MAG: hypothetical protein ACI8RD_007323 [Bacillariaceae sp.]|jgi:hypothetical protein